MINVIKKYHKTEFEKKSEKRLFKKQKNDEYNLSY